MSKAKLRWITILALAAACILTLGFAVAALPFGRKISADAAATYTPANLFQEVDGATVAGEKNSFVQFSLATGNRVEYRRDLALKWYAAGEAEEGGLANPGEEKHFSMTFAFGAIVFESFDITFQSAEENVTKDGQTTNVLHFEYKVPEGAAEGAEKVLTLAVRDAEYEEGDEDEIAATIADLAADLTFELIEDTAVPGNFNLKLTQGNEAGAVIGAFTNVGGYYMEYRSTSATSPQLPMAFEATLPADAAEDAKQTILMKSLNGQSLALNADGQVDDKTPAVLVVNEKIYSFRLGQRFSLTYEAIDVCDNSVTVTRQYCMLEYEEAEGEEGENAPEANAEGETEKNYKKPADADYSSLSSSSTFFIPAGNDVLDTDEDGKETAYVSIRFKLDDGTDENDTYVYLTWYAAQEAGVVTTKGNETYREMTGYKCPDCGKVMTEEDYNKALEENGEAVCTGEKDNPSYDPNATEGDASKEKIPCGNPLTSYEEQWEGNYFDYIIVNREVAGPYFKGLEKNDDTQENDSVWTDNAVEEYQTKLEEAAKDVSAGDGAYFYLPSLETLIGSDYADYRNLRFNIYYFKPTMETGATASSATSLRYNNLRFEVDQVGLYTFRVIAQDAAGNAMKYYDKDKDLVTVTASNVFDIEGIPEFTIDIKYDGPSIEESGSQSLGYNKQNYSISSFDIIALEGYETEYKLYSFTTAEGQKAYSAEDLVELFDKVKENLFEEGKENTAVSDTTYGSLTARMKEIQVYDPDVSEDDAKWDETNNAYAWDPESSLSFTPQADGLYVVGVKVIDGSYPGKTAYAYKVIEVTHESDIIYRSSNWIENNLAAVILFAISGVLLVAIILLLVVKPNEKNLEEVDLSTLKGVKKKGDAKPEDTENE